MNTPAIIKAVYATWRPVPTRKVLQIIMEVPIEQTETVMKTLGVPDVGTSTWCAIAKLDVRAASLEQTQPEPSAAAPSKADIPIKQGRKFSELPRSQQAALKCQDLEFQDWLSHAYPAAWNAVAISEISITGEDMADRVVKRILRISSKRALDDVVARGEDWDKLLTEFDVRNYRR